MAFKKIGVYSISLLGALGTGLQNYMGVATFIQGLMSVSYAAGRTGLGIVHSIAVLLGGLCSTFVNFCINIELLEDFYERVTQKPRPQLAGWQKFRYYAGNAVFIGTGILFGLTAIAFGPVGPLAVLGIIAGVFVSIIMIIQELETWLASFDQAEQVKKPLLHIFKEWKNALTPGKGFGFILSIGNVIALSLLFTIGLSSFFIGVGVPALPALIVGFAVAFTGGAFTEFYFYNRFLANFCDQFKEKWQQIKKTAYPLLGVSCAAANAFVNGALAYAGIFMITALFAAASIAVPPVGALIAVAAVTGLFAGAASFILGLDFWLRNSAKLKGYGSQSKTTESGDKNTQDILQKFPLLAKPSLTVSTEAERGCVVPLSKKRPLFLHFQPLSIQAKEFIPPQHTGTYVPR